LNGKDSFKNNQTFLENTDVVTDKLLRSVEWLSGVYRTACWTWVVGVWLPGTRLLGCNPGQVAQCSHTHPALWTYSAI